MGRKMQAVSSLAFDAYIAKKLGISYGEYSAAVTPKERRTLEEKHWPAFRKAQGRAYTKAKREQTALGKGQMKTGL